MSNITHPRNPDQITEEWMDYAFSERGISKSGTISNIKVEPLGPHVKGLLSSMCRVKITYETKQLALPSSVVIKFPPVIEERRNFGNKWRVFQRELMFYREIATRSPIRLPNCYFTVMDEAKNDFLIMMEDAGGWTPGDQVDGLTINQTKSAVTAISKFHGYWWDSEELGNLNWMPEENLSSIYLFNESWKDFSEEHKQVLSSQDIAAGNLIAQSGQKIHDLSFISPRTIIHYDFRADNMMFNEQDEILVVDWQTALRSLGAFDVVRAVCGSHHGVLERVHHREFLGMWYEGLLESGVKNFSIEEAWRDYRLSIILSAYVPVAAHHFLSHEGSHGISILQAMIKRIFYAIHECDTLELLS
ncbi:MAG: phosphotransferase [Candidatus Dadabacteria bacterium]